MSQRNHGKSHSAFHIQFYKKLIKLNEKYEVANNIFMWQYMRVIPLKNDPNNTWFVPLSMELS